MGERREPERLSAADGAWWRMERPTNPMTITAVFTFAEPLRYAALVDLVTGGLLPQPRFRQRVVDRGAGRVEWSEPADVRMADHVVRVALPATGARGALQALVGRLMSEPLPADRPLWQFHLVEQYEGGSAMVARVHHCIGDGISLVQLLLSLAGSTPRAGTVEERTPQARPRRDERREHAGALAAVRAGGSAAAVLGRLLDLRADPKTVLQGPLGRVKRAAWSDPIPLESVRRIGRATGGTINDVLTAAVAGALRRYLAARGDRVDGRTLRAVVPVNLRGPGDQTLGNKFGLVFLPLAVGERDPVRRAHRTARAMDAIKRSPEAAVIFGLLRAFGRTTAGVLVAAVTLLARRASLVMTNVPGPRAPIRFAGATVDGVMFWVPQSGAVGLGVSVLSYAGEVRVGVAADERLVPDPGDLVAAFHDALAELAAAVEGPSAPLGAVPPGQASAALASA